jgi:hypothetical protein
MGVFSLLVSVWVYKKPLEADGLLLLNAYPLRLPFIPVGGGWLFAESWSRADLVKVGGGEAKLEKE